MTSLDTLLLRRLHCESARLGQLAVVTLAAIFRQWMKRHWHKESKIANATSIGIHTQPASQTETPVLFSAYLEVREHTRARARVCVYKCTSALGRDISMSLRACAHIDTHLCFKASFVSWCFLVLLTVYIYISISWRTRVYLCIHKVNRHINMFSIGI